MAGRYSQPRRINILWPACVLMLSFLGVGLTGCSSARVAQYRIDDDFRAGRFADAEAELRKGLAEQGEDGRDKLLYLLDLGLTLHEAGKYQESIKVFFEADRYADISDYTSLSKEAATLLVSDNSKPYKGEDFEKVMINLYLCLGFAFQGQWEDALVEARILNRKLYRMIFEGERKYKQNAFVRYFSSILYEAEGNWNDAYIDLKYAYELEGQNPAFRSTLGRDLVRLALKMGHREDQEKWTSEFGFKKADIDEIRDQNKKSNETGEVVIVFQNGLAPVKKPNPSWNSLPHFYARYNPVTAAKVSTKVSGEDRLEEWDTIKLHDIEATAIQNMEDNYGAAVAKKVAGGVAKIVVGKQVENITGSQLAGFLTQIALFAGDRADLRSWRLLPKDLQIARIRLKPGKHVLKFKFVGVEAEGPTREVDVIAGKTQALGVRYFPPY